MFNAFGKCFHVVVAKFVIVHLEYLKRKIGCRLAACETERNRYHPALAARLLMHEERMLLRLLHLDFAIRKAALLIVVNRAE